MMEQQTQSKLRYLVVLGASANPSRYSHQAVREGLEHGLNVLGVHPNGENIEGATVFETLAEVREVVTREAARVDTLSVYVNKDIISRLLDEIVALAPRRIILNPGADDPKVREQLKEKGLNVIEACTLVLFRTGQY